MNTRKINAAMIITREPSIYNAQHYKLIPLEKGTNCTISKTPACEFQPSQSHLEIVLSFQTLKVYNKVKHLRYIITTKFKRWNLKSCVISIVVIKRFFSFS